MNYTQFAQRIKNKYPQYKDIDDLELAKKVISKYPQYQQVVEFDTTPIEQPEIVYSPPGKTWRDYSGETVIGLSIMIVFSLFYIYSIVKKKEISGWRRLFLVMVVIPGTVLMFNDDYDDAVFLAVLFCFIYGVVWTIQGFRKK